MNLFYCKKYDVVHSICASSHWTSLLSGLFKSNHKKVLLDCCLFQVGRKQAQMKSTQNERTVQAKKIQDLERQVTVVVEINHQCFRDC